MRYVQRVQSGNKRSRGSSSKIDWDVDSIGRVLRVLERTMRDGEAQVVFPNDVKASNVGRAKTKGARKKKSESKSKSPEEDDEMNGAAGGESEELSEKELRDGDDKLAALQAAGLAAACCMTIMDTHGLPKHVGHSLLLDDNADAALDSIGRSPPSGGWVDTGSAEGCHHLCGGMSSRQQ